MSVRLEVHRGDVPDAIEAVRRLIEASGRTLVQAAFEESLFVHPDAVRALPLVNDKYVRHSQRHYGDPSKAVQRPGVWQGKPVVVIKDNREAQSAWDRYTGVLTRGSGYGVRHIWGNPWDPIAYTAGWNICYMPFWVGMATEEQHRDDDLTKAIRQASFNLYFRESPVCPVPPFVADPGVDLERLLDGRPIRVAMR